MKSSQPPPPTVVGGPGALSSSSTTMTQTQSRASKPNRPKRKKTSRACIHCQKAHVTCDEGRPCQRCIKKGCQNSCHDGIRKQAKYLQENEDASIATKSASFPNHNNSIQNPVHHHHHQPNWPNTLPNLSASMQLPGYLPPTPPEGAIRIPKYDEEPQQQASNLNPMRYQQQQQNQQQQGSGNASGYSPDATPYDFGSKAANLEYSILSNILRTTDRPLGSISEASDVSMLSNTMTTPESDSPTTANLQPQQSQPLDWSAYQTQSQIISSPTEQETHPEEVYERVKSPYPYTQGYHALIAYLRSRFKKKELIHMAQAMAAYRPSFIATTKTLKEEDLIFMEKCFQRTLLEFEKFISCSGTPTVVWRRTGQIAAVGKEFCILTEWPRERLINQQTFIVELMDDKSVTSYFDLFSRLAFGDSRGVTMSECTLLKPSGAKVPAACTWTVKRDVFDIPMMIIGNFLPILS